MDLGGLSTLEGSDKECPYTYAATYSEAQMVYLVLTRCGADLHASPCNDVSVATPEFKRGTTWLRFMAPGPSIFI